MAIEGPYNLEEIFQSVNFDFLTSLPEDEDFGEETLCIPNDALDGMPWYGATEKVARSFPSTPERGEEKKKGFLSEAEAEYSSSSSSSSSSSEGSAVGFGARKRRSGTGKRRGGAEGWKRARIVNGGGGEGEDGRRRCSHCGAEKTPQWRMGPRGPKTLCNACGVRYRSGRLVPEYRPAASPSFDSKIHSNSHRRIVKMRKN